MDSSLKLMNSLSEKKNVDPQKLGDHISSIGNSISKFDGIYKKQQDKSLGAIETKVRINNLWIRNQIKNNISSKVKIGEQIVVDIQNFLQFDGGPGEGVTMDESGVIQNKLLMQTAAIRSVRVHDSLSNNEMVQNLISGKQTKECEKCGRTFENWKLKNCDSDCERYSCKPCTAKEFKNQKDIKQCTNCYEMIVQSELRQFIRLYCK